MTITKELLCQLHFISMDLILGNQDYLVSLFRQNNDEWELKLSNKLELKNIQTVTLKLIFDDYQTECSVLIKETGEDFIIVNKPERNDDMILQQFIQQLNKIEYNNEKYGRRKEERIRIGLEKYKDFNLSKPEQTIIIEENRYINQCAIVDVSLHGIQIVTPYMKPIEKTNNFFISVSFINPSETIIINLHKVYTRLTKINNRIYANLSCQILEPVNYIWKERVINIIQIQNTINN